METKLKLVYDIASTPKGLDIANFTKLWEQHHVVFWDSSREGTKPKIYGDDTEALLPYIVDTKGKEIDLAYWNKVFQDEEFWARELHNCQTSPIYFWKHYGTSEYPATDKGISSYMTQIGAGKIVAKDDEDAKKLWDKQKLIIKKTTDTYTLDLLKERKAIVDALKAAYGDSVGKLEKAVGSFVRLVDSNNVPLGDKKRVGNLVDKIKRNLPVHKKWSSKYRTAKGKWDLPVMFVTDYAILLQIFYDILKDSNRLNDAVVSPTKELEGTEVQPTERATDDEVQPK